MTKIEADRDSWLRERQNDRPHHLPGAGAGIVRRSIRLWSIRIIEVEDRHDHRQRIEMNIAEDHGETRNTAAIPAAFR